jgi:hypothetical protein
MKHIDDALYAPIHPEPKLSYDRILRDALREQREVDTTYPGNTMSGGLATSSTGLGCSNFLMA